jgi:hypothetical protein
MKHADTLLLYKITCTKAYIAFDELGERYDIRPWSGNTEYYEGHDDGGKLYVLPQGLKITIGETYNGTPALFDKNNNIVPIVTDETGLPVLVLGWQNMPVLQPLVTADRRIGGLGNGRANL